jgi:Uri superfamily endonuclease
LKGTYTILLVCMKPFRVKIGRLGYADIGKGYYVYTGSALGHGSGSLEGRLERHLRASKKAKWHVDYLTSDPRCIIKAAVCLTSRKRLECAINQAVARKLNAEPVLARAGSSDCKCDAHLNKIGSSTRAGKTLQLVMGAYRRFGSRVHCIQFTNSVYKNAGHPNLVEGTCDKRAGGKGMATRSSALLPIS